MKPFFQNSLPLPAFLLGLLLLFGWTAVRNPERPRARLVASPRLYFHSFVDCNMAEAWIGDTFRIFPGKYGEDPLWGDSRELKYADGANPEEVFLKSASAFKEPRMPANAAAGTPGLHGAVWFETVYQDRQDPSGKTLFAIFHNENYPSTLPYDPTTGTGYKNDHWPQGLKGEATPTAVCRIGVMKSKDGGHSWINCGLFVEDLQPRLILKPFNTSINFAGGTGDPSAVASGDSLYLFYGEYGYPADYDSATYGPVQEYQGQCISVARIALKDLDHPQGKARRWNGHAFGAAYNAAGAPIQSLQIPLSEGGGPTSSPKSKYYWGPSVSWNSYLQAWVMLMAKAEGPSWQGNSLYISFNTHPDLGKAGNSQDWSKPERLLQIPGHTLWYPSLQPLASPEDIARRHTCLLLGKRARLFFKDNHQYSSSYLSDYTVEFQK